MRYRIILIVSLLLTMATDAFAYIAKPSKLTPTITWEITDDGVLRIYGTGEMPDFEYGEHNFWLDKKYFPNKIKRIEIGEGIIKIGKYAFHSQSIFSSDKLKDVVISLPSTLTSLGSNALDGVKLESSRLPDKILVLSEGSLGGALVPDGILIIPPSVKRIENLSLGLSNLKEIIIEGTPKLGHSAFLPLSNISVTFRDPAIELISLIKDPRNWTTHTAKVSNITLIVPESTSVPKEFESLVIEKSYKIEVNNEIEVAVGELEYRAENDSKISISIDEYLSQKMPTWEEYLSVRASTLPKQVTEYNAKADINFRIEKWQKKGEFESTEEWKNRVNEKTRAEMLAKLTAEWNKKSQETAETYNRLMAQYKKEYEQQREAHKKEFYINLAKAAIKEYKSDSYRLDSPYDADNQTFLINTKYHGDILLSVPRSEAQGFKQNWSSIVSKMDFAFLPDSESSVGLSRIIFPYNGKEYSYDGKTQTAYKVEDPNYAFTPLEVTGLKIDDLAVADIPAPESQGKLLTQQKQNDTKKGKTILSDIDQDIPNGTIKRDKTFAFIIANENYTRTDPVTFALNDGESMKKYCEKTLGIPTSNITYVADASLNDMRYQLKRISDICSAFGNEASVLVYYAGHGVPEEGSSDAYLLPVDGYAESVKTGLSLKEMVDALGGLPASNVTLLLDACFSGTGREGKTLYASRGVAMKPKSVMPKGNLVLFSASQGVESAQPYKEKGHGLFTYYLLKKLKETKGQVNLGELTEYVIDNVKRTSVVEGKIQTPTVNASSDKADWREINL